MIQIDTKDGIILDGTDTGYCVRQDSGGTKVWNRATGEQLNLPKPRYALSCDAPASGAPGKTHFEDDFRQAIQ